MKTLIVAANMKTTLAALTKSHHDYKNDVRYHTYKCSKNGYVSLAVGFMPRPD